MMTFIERVFLAGIFAFLAMAVAAILLDGLTDTALVIGLACGGIALFLSFGLNNL